MKHMNTPELIAVDCEIVCSPNVSVQPRVRVERWRTYSCDDEIFLLCELPETGRIRATTAIAHWDTTAGEVVTQSGRIYELVGPMAEDSLDFKLAMMVSGAGL